MLSFFEDCLSALLPILSQQVVVMMKEDPLDWLVFKMCPEEKERERRKKETITLAAGHEKRKLYFLQKTLKKESFHFLLLIFHRSSPVV